MPDFIVSDCFDIAICVALARLKGRRVVSLPPSPVAACTDGASPFAGWFQ